MSRIIINLIIVLDVSINYKFGLATTQVFQTFTFTTLTSRTDLETLICDYGDETFDSFNVTQDIKSPVYKRIYGLLPSNLSNYMSLNIPGSSDKNRFILANTEFANDIMLTSIDILPTKIGFVTLSIISFQIQCNVSCFNQLQQLNSNILDSQYKLSENMTFEFKNLSLHTFYLNMQSPYEAG